MLNEELYEALRAGNLTIVKRIIPSEISVEPGYGLSISFEDGMTNLMMAIKYGHLDIVKYLIENGASIENTQREKFWKNSDLPFSWWSSLMLASHYNHPEIVEYLIQKGAEVNYINLDGTSALIIASLGGNLEIVKSLVKSGAKINVRNSNGNSALMAASRSGNLPIVEYLVENSANLNLQDFGGWTALIHAISSGKINVVKYLVQKDVEAHSDKKGLNIYNLTYGDGNNLLMLAVKYKKTEILRFLLQNIPFSIKEKQLDAGNLYGMTALIMASQYDDINILKLLLDNGASINYQGKFGDTALIMAAKINNEKAIQILLERGANPMIRGQDRKTAYEISDDQTKLIFKEFYEKQMNNLRGNQQTYFNVVPKDLINLIYTEIIYQL